MIGALTDLLQSFYHNGDLSQVEVLAQTILTAIPDDIVALHFLGFAYLKRGRRDEAQFLFQKLRGKISRKLNRERPAQSENAASSVSLKEATERNPAFADTWYRMAMELNSLGYPEQAMLTLRHAIAARPDFDQALLALGDIALSVADLPAAEEAYANVLERHAEHAEARRGMERIRELRVAETR